MVNSGASGGGALSVGRRQNGGLRQQLDHDRDDGAGRQVEHDRHDKPSRHWTRTIEVYVPPNYVRGTEAPFIVLGDGGSTALKDMNTTLDNLVAQRRVPPMVSIQIGNGGQDAQGARRGREYDTVSGTYAQLVEREVLPLVEQRAGVKLTKNPEGRATMGLSSSGTAAFTMAWYHPELYHRVLAYSPTMVNQQWPWGPSLRGGAWEYHSAWAGPAGPGRRSV
jgi:enterochelin esterase-like enzyme